MLINKLRSIREDEGGFTLIELLVVILIVGILAAIALPTFLGQQKKGQDADAKSNARNLVSHVEACFADTQTYESCDTVAELGTTGLPQADSGTAQGTVVVSGASADDYVITAYSKSAGTFTITKTNGAGPVRTCSGGSCKGGTW